MLRKCFVIVLFIFMIFPINAALADELTNRVTEFYTKVFTGKDIQLKEWFVKDIPQERLTDPYFGVESMIKISTRQALRNGGLKTIKVINVKKSDTINLVEVEIVFNNSEKITGGDVWIIEDSKWKITRKPGQDDNFGK